MSEIKQRYDVLVIGGGIAGIETALTTADAGFKVLLVEREGSIGGIMALLSKVFPTLDCASCISTPKMAAAAHHPNIDILTYSEVKEIEKISEGNFKVKILKKPRYVDIDKCTGCSNCELVCPVIVPDEFQYNMRGRKAAYIPFDIAIPKKAIIDIDNCIFCGSCERVCPANAINFLQEPENVEINVGAVVIATGFKLFDATKKPMFGFGKYKNVITAMQMDRLLAPTRPFNSVMRPSDGKEPMKIAYIFCVGSRDVTVGNPLCSQVCCMYSIKQAQLLMGALPLADIYLFYIDIRAYGKGFEEFYQQAKDMGVWFIKGRPKAIIEQENGDILVKYEDIEDGGKIKEDTFDLVVLSVGLLPHTEISKLFKNKKLELNEYGWVKKINECKDSSMTSIPGVFVAGCACGPKDIPDSIVEAESAAANCISYLLTLKNKAEA